MKGMRKLIAGLVLCAAALPGVAQADPPPYDPISICNIPEGTCDPSLLPSETIAFVCSLLWNVNTSCADIIH